MVVYDWSPPTSATLEDLGGIDDCIQEVLELIVMPLKHPEIYSHTGVQPPRYLHDVRYLILGAFCSMDLQVAGKLFLRTL